jgi:predicted acyltransferase
MVNQQSDPQPHAVAPAARLVSLDALRGYTMLWILGADSVFTSLSRFGDNGWTGALAQQFHHVPWEGLRFYDLIFPMFVFIVGVSLVFSLDRIVEKTGKLAAHGRVFRRFSMIFLLGVFYDEGIVNWQHENVLCGVPQRIALTYLIASLLYLNLRLRGLIITFVTVLLAYWVLMCFVKVPGEPVLTFARHHVWSDYIDTLIPPYHDSDPEGFLSTLPASCSALLGIFAGLLLKSGKYDERRKIQWLIGGGAALLVVGLLWGMQFPIIKREWTSTYVLAAGGHSLIMLGIFYTVIDRWKIQKWATPFLWIGMNPLTLYMTANIVDMEAMARRLVGGPLENVLGPFGGMLVSATAVGLLLLLGRFLYERKVFLRV